MLKRSIKTEVSTGKLRNYKKNAYFTLPRLFSIMFVLLLSSSLAISPSPCPPTSAICKPPTIVTSPSAAADMA